MKFNYSFYINRPCIYIIHELFRQHFILKISRLIKVRNLGCVANSGRQRQYRHGMYRKVAPGTLQRLLKRK